MRVFMTTGRYVPISDREFDVWRLIARGYTQKSAASELGISCKTLSSHVEHLKAKLHLDRTLAPTSQLVLLGVRYGIVEMPVDATIPPGITGDAQSCAVNLAVHRERWGVPVAS